MKRLFLFALILAPIPASAQYYNAQRMNGNQTYYSGGNGYNGYGYQQNGNQGYYQDNRGRNCFSQRYGSQTTTDCN
jgi:hypothetical protein